MPSMSLWAVVALTHVGSVPSLCLTGKVTRLVHMSFLKLCWLKLQIAVRRRWDEKKPQLHHGLTNLAPCMCPKIMVLLWLLAVYLLHICISTWHMKWIGCYWFKRKTPHRCPAFFHHAHRPCAVWPRHFCHSYIPYRRLMAVQAGAATG